MKPALTNDAPSSLTWAARTSPSSRRHLCRAARRTQPGARTAKSCARLTLGDIDVAGGAAEFSLFGQNLTDDRYKTTAVDIGALGFAAGAFNRPRVIGVEARLAF